MIVKNLRLTREYNTLFIADQVTFPEGGEASGEGSSESSSKRRKKTDAQPPPAPSEATKKRLESTEDYPEMASPSDKVEDYLCILFNLPNRGTLRRVEEFCFNQGGFLPRQVCVIYFIISTIPSSIR